tara:strand:- start:567 stop:1016 length:450 start_codon:yes stop_codon:yes gene_type:complete
MLRLFGILLVGSTLLFSSANSIGSSPVEEAVQKRIKMFKSSGTNIKKLNQLIRSGDFSSSDELVDFHVKFSEDMRLLFPVGSEASTSNGSDASSDIWRDTSGFEKQIQQYNLSSIELKEAVKSKNINLINKKFEGLIKSCKSCHKQFRN